MMRAIATIAGATVLLAASMSATPASALPVNRPLADQFTQQYNQQELQQLQASEARVYTPARIYSQTHTVQINEQPLGPAEAPPPPPPRPLYAPQPEWSYLPR